MKPRLLASPLRTQILTRTLVVALVPLALLATAAVVGLRGLEGTAADAVASSRRTVATETVGARLRSEAETAAGDIQAVLTDRVSDVVGWSRQPTVIDGAEAATQLAAANGLLGLEPAAAESRFAGTVSLAAGPAAEALLVSERERLPGFVDISYTDRHGFNAGAVGPVADFVQSDEAWWQLAWDRGLYVGAVEVDPESGRAVIPIASRIENDSGDPLGVLRGSLSIDFVAAITEARRDDGLDLAVVAVDGQLLAETASGQDEARIGSIVGSGSELATAVEAAREHGSGSVTGVESVAGYATIAAVEAEGSDRAVTGGLSDWSVIALQPIEAAFAPLAGLDQLEGELSDAGRDLSAAVMVMLGVSVATAVAMAAILSHQIVTPIEAMTTRARRAAERDLPAAVDQLQDDPDLATVEDTGIELSGGRELEELGHSFNSVQRTAIRLAGEQASQRRATAEMFANLGRRNQSLVKRQLRFIEELEQAEEDPDRLGSLFKLDHLATRMRRNAESLLVIAGHRTNLLRSAPVRMELVVQAALGEVENFERVDIEAIEPAAVAGRGVSDVAHVLAELIENALAFSPPESSVIVTGRSGSEHYAVSVADGGIGMTDEEMAEANARLADTSGEGPDRVLTPSKHLGLLVVSKLAERHGLVVRLESPDDGGVVAVVEIPNELIVPAAEAPVTPSEPAPTVDEPAPAPERAKPPQPPHPAPSQATSTPTRGDFLNHPVAPPVAEPDRDREPDTPRRRSTDTPAVDPLGGLSPVSAAQISTVTQRPSRRPVAGDDTVAPTTTAPRTKRSVVTTDSAEDVAGEAAELADRWSSFQRGRRQATTEADQPPTD